MHPLLRFAWLAAFVVAALAPRPAAAAGPLTECTQAALEQLLLEGGTIVVDCNGTIVLDSPLTVDVSVILDATGRNFTIAGPSGTGANSGVRLFQVSTGVSLTLINLTLSGGRSTNGGAIYNHGGIVTLQNCLLTSNSVVGTEGLAGSKGGDSSFQLGHKGRNGGSGHAAHGGAIYNFRGTILVDGCTFYTNTVRSGSGGHGGTGGDGYAGGGDGGTGGDGGVAQGGAIYNEMGTLRVIGSLFSFNVTSAGSGGAGGTNGTGLVVGLEGHGGHGGTASGGAIYSTRKARSSIAGSTFSGNRTTSGVSANAGSTRGPSRHGPSGPNAFGGAICNYGTITCTNSTFFRNFLRAGTGGRGGDSDAQGGRGGAGGAAWGGALFSSGNAQVGSSTFSDNVAGAGTNGIEGVGLVNGKAGTAGRSNGANLASGSGVFALGNTLLSNPRGFKTNLTETNITCVLTITTNVVGGTNADEIIWTTNLTFRSDGFTTTIVDLPETNTGVTGTGLVNGSELHCTTNTRPLTLSSDRSNGYGAFRDRGGNLSTDRSLKLNTKNRFSIFTNDARLAVLADNGGLTLTVALLADSPAIDAGNAVACPATDQRGALRPAGSRCDIGAFEFGGTPAARPVITTSPVPQTVRVGVTASFMVVANGTAPLAYEWRHNGTAIPGATGPLLTLNNVQTADAGTYLVVVANVAGSATASATLEIPTPITISRQPVSTNVVQGDTASFSVTATGGGTIGYRWYVSQNMPIPGATSATLTLLNAATNLAGDYFVILTNQFYALTSAPATLTVQVVAPLIVTHPENADVPPGESAQFSVTASGSLPLQFLWFKDGTNLVESSLLNTRTSTHFVTNVQGSDTGTYHAVMTNISGSVTSAPATLSTNLPRLLLTLQPTNTTTFRGSNATFTAAASSPLPVFYQWRFNGEPIPRATNATLTLANVAYTNAGTYEVVVTNRYSSVTSDAVALTVFAPFTLSCPPGNPLVCTITVSSEEGVDYTIQYFDTDSMTWVTIETKSGDGGAINFTDIPAGGTAPSYRVLGEPGVPPDP